LGWSAGWGGRKLLDGATPRRPDRLNHAIA
jgi:hypothetical protein